MEITIISPLTEEELKKFCGRECDVGAIFDKKGRRFVGHVLSLEYETDNSQIVTDLNVTFYWIREVRGQFLESVKNKTFENVKQRFPFPHIILESCRPGEILTCCAGEKCEEKIKPTNEVRIKLTKKVSHVLSIATLKHAEVPEKG
jgi:hypothetical protein